ncbi:hypothetical protein HYW83_01220 [Candidatus Peregrinibacteria bacterium]|nr:hypothetical protein [Candidatus Peregrinibacteria bacterium]
MSPPADTPAATPSPSPAPEAAPAAADAREQVQQTTRDALADLRTAIDQELRRFKTRVEDEGSDFKDSDEDLEKSAGFKAARDGLRLIFESDKSDTPINFKNAWWRAMTEFMVTKINSYEGSWGVMKTIDVEKALEELNGLIGSFEQWIEKPGNPHKVAYDKWKAERAGQEATENAAEVETQRTQAEQAAQAAALAAQKQELGGVASQLEARLTVLSQAIVPAALLKQIQDLKGQIADDDGTHLETHRATAATLEPQIAAVEALKELAENPDIPEARKNEILAKVREGQDPAQAKKDLEAALQAGNLPPPADEDAPIGDRLLGWADALPDGPMKKMALGIASFFATLCTAKWIGGWFRGRLMSNRTLAEKFGDAEAAKAVKVEQEFRRFGLPENLVPGLGGKKTKEVLALMRQKPADITKDTAQQQKLGRLADNIEAKGGAVSDDTLVDFMSNGNVWKDVVYPGAALAAAGTAAGGAAPAAAPEPAVAETPDQKFAKIFEGMTPDKKIALESAKAKEVAAGTLPDLIKDDDRAKKIAAKLKTNGADQITDPNQTVRQFIETHLVDKDWAIA